MNEVIERINIENFFSIKKFDWEINDFNILTGGMATGKSICIKLVNFVEQVLHVNIFLFPISKDTLTRDTLYYNISEQFISLFHSKNPEKDFNSNTKIEYKFKVLENNMIFDLNAYWDENNKKLKWQSNYIDAHIDQWRDLLGDTYTPDAVRTARVQIYENIAFDFMKNFPIATMLIPSSRAIACVADKITTKDKFLSDFFDFYKQFVLEFNDVSDEQTNKILHLSEIKVIQESNTKEKSISFITLTGKEITSLELSSGQQELIFLLLLINDLPGTRFYFGERTSVFIEEPEAHLFPQEQKDSIEFFTKIFRELKDGQKKNVRYFITTHSPYVLNVINNMLTKGGIINKNKDKITEIDKEIKFPCLYANELSATFINEDGTIDDILDSKEEQIFPSKISKISFSIVDDINKLDNLYNKLLQAKQGN
jgi:predicted ATPase